MVLGQVFFRFHAIGCSQCLAASFAQMLSLAPQAVFLPAHLRDQNKIKQSDLKKIKAGLRPLAFGFKCLAMVLPCFPQSSQPNVKASVIEKAKGDQPNGPIGPITDSKKFKRLQTAIHRAWNPAPLSSLSKTCLISVWIDWYASRQLTAQGPVENLQCFKQIFSNHCHCLKACSFERCLGTKQYDVQP